MNRAGLTLDRSGEVPLWLSGESASTFYDLSCSYMS